MNKKEIRDLAKSTIYEMWGCIDWDKVDTKRAYGIWDEFASKVKAAALTTNNYEKFVEKLGRKMGIRSLRYRTIKDIHEMEEEIKQEILKVIREETLQIVLQVRLDNEIRREMKASLKKQEEERKAYKEKNNQVEFTDKGAKINE